ncbi:PcfB family protein [Lachnospiraceae bacterium 54-11]
MQDEVSEKLIGVCINGGKISARILKDTLEKALDDMERSSRQKEQYNASAKQKEKKQAVSHGKQSLKKLAENGAQLSNIEVTDGNIKSFARCARKYNIDYSLKKDKSVSPPRYFVFFRAKDVDSITAAFKEYTGRTLNKAKKPSVRKKLELAKERVAKHREREKTKHRDRGQEL